jgi:xanthine phosphoribosyltransferase
MKELEDRIRAEGKALNEDVLRVDMFLNHQVDCRLMDRIGDEFARLFREDGITRVVTIEASGIAPAAMTALKMNVPMVILKKSASVTLNSSVLQTEVYSFTKQNTYQLTLKGEYITPGDRVLLIDDFLANGAALSALLDLAMMAGAEVVGAGIAIEKAYQPGGELIRGRGVRVESLARIRAMSEEGGIEFC